MRLCVDCRHFDSKTTECSSAPYRSPVTGAHLFYFANVERAAQTLRACGPDGKRFQAKVLVPAGENPF